MILEAEHQRILEEWMDEYGTRILRTLYLITHDYQAAEDITQETFIRAFRYMEDFKGESSPYTWLYRIALNAVRSYLRSRAFRFTTYLGNRLESQADNPIEAYMMYQGLRNCILKLPPKYREVIVLYYYNGLSVHELADILRQSEGTIKSKLSRGREKLKDLLEKEGVSDEWGEEQHILV